jgi:glutamine synthetase adenylyltransferase
VLRPGTNFAAQISALAEAGAVNGEDARTLADGAAFLRSADHAVRLVTGKPGRTLPSHAGRAEAVANLMVRWGIIEKAKDLRPHLRAVQHELRGVYRKVVGAERVEAAGRPDAPRE